MQQTPPEEPRNNPSVLFNAVTPKAAVHDGQTLVSTQTVQHDYVTQNGKVVRETVRTNGSITAVLDFIYDESGSPFAFRYSTNGSSFTTYYYVLNLQGDVVKLINASGATVAEYTYNAWGEILTSKGDMASINPLRYRSYYYDSETGFYYLQSRYYDPVTHRFINADVYTSTDSTYAISCNMFAYCENNPVSFSDPSGEFGLLALCLIGGFVSAAIDYGSQVYSNYQNGVTGSEMLTDVNWGHIASSGVSGAVSAIPGAGGVTTAVDILLCPVVEETVNCIVEGDSFNTEGVVMGIAENALDELFFSQTVGKAFPSLEMPGKIGDIKQEARTLFGIKGKNKLEKYLNRRQLFTIGYNTARYALYD